MTATRKFDDATGAVDPAQSNRLRKFLFQTSALGIGVSLAVLKAGAAEAQVCTTTPGSVACPEGTYASGLGYNVSQDTTVTIAPGSAVGGLIVNNVNGIAGVDLNIAAPGVNFTRTISPQTPVVYVHAGTGVPAPTAGDVSIVVGNVEASPGGGIGIYGFGHNVSIVADSARTHSLTGSPYAILADTSLTGGNIFVDVGEVSTEGNSFAVLAYAGAGAAPATNTGNIVVHADNISTTGTGAWGILAQSGSGTVDVFSGTITTTGDRGEGLEAVSNYGAVSVTSESVTTQGFAGRGIVAAGGGGATIDSHFVSVSGATGPTGVRSIGIIGTAIMRPDARDGDVLINSDLVEFSGPGSIAIFASSYDGDITINTDSVVGNASPHFSDPAAGGTGLLYSPVAIATDNATGNVTINSGSIINHSQNGAGIAVNTTTGLVTINTGLIDTYGDGAMGITTGGAHGDIVINSGAITTHGDAVQIDNLAGAYLGRDLFFADAIEAISLSGSVTVNSDDATVLGEGNQGITIIAAQNATLRSGNVKNQGEGQNGIGIVIDNGAVNAELTGVTNVFQGTGMSIVALNDSTVNVTNAGGIFARDGGINVTTGSGATVITNTGNIETTRSETVDAGAAIRVNATAGGSVTINNYGAIRGGVSTTGETGAAIIFSDGAVDETLNVLATTFCEPRGPATPPGHISNCFDTVGVIEGYVDGQGGSDTLNVGFNNYGRAQFSQLADVRNFETVNVNGGLWLQSEDLSVDTINVNSGALYVNAAATGDTTIAAGAELTISDTGSLDGDITANGTLIFSRTNDYTFAGTLGGSGSLIKRGAGLVTLDGLYTFTGTTTIEEGGLKITQLALEGDLNLGDAGEIDLSGGEQSVGGLNGGEGSNVNIDNGSLTVDQREGESSTFGGSLTGDGALTVAGGGELNLTGTNTYTGPTTVENGTLRVNGSITSAVTVNDGSVLGGDGTINGSILIRRLGVINPGNSPGVLTIAGPLTLADGSIFVVEVDPTHPQINDRIDASGIVTIENGALLNVAPQGPINLYQRVNEYTIINASGGLVGTYAAGDVSSSMALLAPHLVYLPTSLRLQLIRNDIPFNSLANSPNQFALATAAEATASGPVYNALVAQSDSGLRTGYDALSGEVYGSVGTFLLHEAGGSRDALLQTAARQTGTGVWVDAAGRQATFNANAGRGSAEAKASSSLISGGGQYVMGDLTFGGMLSMNRTDLDVDLRNNDATIASTRGGVYATGKSGVLIGRVGAEIAQSDIHASRTIVFPGVAEASLSSYNASQMQVFGEVAFDSYFGPANFEPFVGLASVDTDIDSFQESGPLGLKVKASTRHITVASAGFRLTGPDDWALKPRVDVTFRHASGDTAGVVTSAFATGSNFDVVGANMDRDSTVLAAGLDYDIAPGMNLSVDYSGMFSDSTRQNLLGARFVMRF